MRELVGVVIHRLERLETFMNNVCGGLALRTTLGITMLVLSLVDNSDATMLNEVHRLYLDY